MHFRILIFFSDFMQVLNIIRKHYTNNEYFPKHIVFTTIYLMQEQKLNPRHYFEQKINMRNFVYATDHDVHMYAKIQYDTMRIFL
jgi:hypothetical protein